MDKDIEVYPVPVPFLKRFKIHHDLKGYYKVIWLTGYILITWSCWDDLDISFYKDGSYGKC